MSDLLVSLIRTWVPVAVGGLLSLLAAQGVEFDPTTEQGLIVGLTGLITAVYYFGARLLEQKWPSLGILLGSKKQPTYEK